MGPQLKLPKSPSQKAADEIMDSVAIKKIEKKVKRDGKLETDAEALARIKKGE